MSVNHSQVLKRETLAERLLIQLRRQILSGTLAPGQRIPSEQDISLAFGVGRTTVREALGGLVASGFASRGDLDAAGADRVVDDLTDTEAVVALLDGAGAEGRTA